MIYSLLVFSVCMWLYLDAFNSYWSSLCMMGGPLCSSIKPVCRICSYLGDAAAFVYLWLPLLEEKHLCSSSPHSVTLLASPSKPPNQLPGCTVHLQQITWRGRVYQRDLEQQVPAWEHESSTFFKLLFTMKDLLASSSSSVMKSHKCGVWCDPPN